jgi:membrane protease YdiL (CAAX protease family)
LTPSLAEHLLAVLLGIVVPAFAVLRGQPRMKGTTFDTDLKFGMYVGNSLFLWAMAIVVGVVWKLAGRPLADLGLRWGDTSTVWVPVLIVGFALWYGLDTWHEVRSPDRLRRATERWRTHTPFMPETWKEYHVFSLLAVSAGVCEEIVFRGFFISYLLLLLGDSAPATLVALVLPALVFGFSHMYEGLQVVSKIVIMSVAFGIVFILSGSIIVLIVVHILVDLVGGVLGIWLMQRRKHGNHR